MQIVKNFITADKILVELKNFLKIIKFIKFGLVSMVLSILFYFVIYYFVRKDFGGSTEQIFAYSSFGILRIIRNIWVCFINNFGSFTPFIFLFLLIKNVRTKTEWISWLVFFILMSIGGAYWAGDLMMRRIVFAGVILSLAFYKYLGNKSLFLILFLLPITFLNAGLYYKNLTDVPLTSMQNSINKLPKDEVLVQSHYYYPFTQYDGKILWLENDNLDQIEELLKNGTRVFLTKESVTAPYLLLVGNNYHITSLGKAGNSESRKLFEKYEVDKYANSFEIKLPDAKEISALAGQPVVFYGTGFWQRLSRMRINYGDIGIWLWSLISGHKDAAGWTYKDINGAWVWPQISIE